MDVNMSPEEVIQSIQQLHRETGDLNKKKVKKSHPEVMRHALHYFPDWQSAVEKSIS
ncbi:hypothetical protein [Alkalihalobacillus sp. LMS39]|uniref:hypothetical protein n=1 Tax=Alkalihalobacillus sp. LMS39 TaxID=2924032 RepID=UPI001FB1D4E7|nr:hypothetical protein [Alkalihalobacillus sp. LMS39]UOE96132.1 hypothetical protein MM271_11255 [Alkalihalobacillus sp. LMS39]